MLNKIVLPAIIIFASIAVAIWMSAQQSVPDSVPAPPPVMLVDVIEAKISTEKIRVSAQGTVTPRTETTLISEVSGIITEVSPAFVAGGFFSKGDVMIRIDDRNYRAELKRAQASVASARTMVTREAGLADYAEADWQRAKSLLSSSKAASDLALRKPQLAEAIANLDFSQAELDKREGDLDRTVIRAPYDGLVRQKRADVGQYVAAGTPLALTFAVDVAEIRLPLPDRELPYLNLADLHDPASRPEVLLSAEIGGTRNLWKGQIVRTEGVFDERSRVLYVVAQITDPYNQQGPKWPSPLRIGTFVEASIAGFTAENIIKLPRSVLQDANSVWTVGVNSELKLKTVTLLRSDEHSVYINGGLNAGDLICITALDNPLPGTLVRHGKPMQLASRLSANADN
ncbi:MAG: efflux RND transporter periplasmic adaptor subunit [bacterium]|nr:efflux RND transporter periplasmic adaptor subunit [Gammaproteobacteria bacterium]HIL94382.1 efflux RND transporter periplasmic adaptor subunit [Pseudomonadales bacterium]